MPFEWWNVEGAISIVFENPRAGVIVVDLDDGFRAGRFQTKDLSRLSFYSEFYKEYGFEVVLEDREFSVMLKGTAFAPV